MICPYCGKEYTVWITHAKYCQQYNEYKNSILTKDYLYEKYVQEQLSISDIAKQTKLSSGVIKRALQKFNISIKNTHESRFTKSYIEKTKATCQKKFGADYANSKNSTIFGKAKQATFDKYGVYNNFQSEQSKLQSRKTCLQKYGYEYATSSPLIKEKVMQTCLERYGYANASQVPEFINKQKLNRHKNNSSAYNSPLANKFFQNLLQYIPDNEHIYCANKGHEYCIMCPDKTLYFYDFVDTQNKKCIEFNGNYWHANPQMYESTWINPHNNLTAQQIWEKDKKKIDALIQQRDYEVLVIWEQDVITNMENEINKCIKFLTQ